jgi:putative addiction module antidote
MTYKQKLTRIGNSVGIIIPKQLLDNLKLTVGNEIYLEQVQDKVILDKNESTSITPEFLKVAESIGNRYSEAFKELAS